MFFFEKKNQKTFSHLVRSLIQAAVSDSERKWKKFFGSFFQKRTSFLPYSSNIARNSSLAFSQSRRTVRSVSPSAAPISASVNPPK